MKNEQAISIIKQACASIQANLETHQQIQAAIQQVEAAVLTLEVQSVEEEQSNKPKKQTFCLKFGIIRVITTTPT